MKRILLADDDADVRAVLELILRSGGYVVDSVATQAAALARLPSQRYDLVVADAVLGDGPGIAIADRAAQLGMAAIIVTGYGSRIAKAEADRHEHVMKPIRAPELLAVVERHIGKARD